jgi:DNA-binding GntR family transcriptional regulator
MRCVYIEHTTLSILRSIPARKPRARTAGRAAVTNPGGAPTSTLVGTPLKAAASRAADTAASLGASATAASPPPSRPPRRDLTAQAYEQLRNDVLDGRIRPEEALFEVHLAERLGMSRTPVREALKLLVQQGYLEELPSRGYALPRRSLDDLREFFELREVLEAAATRYAALRATPAELQTLAQLCEAYAMEPQLARWNRLGGEFHDLIIAAGHNGRLRSALEALNAQIQMSRRPVVQATPAWRRTAIADHRAILAALQARDAEAAHRAAAEHVRHSFAATVQSFQPSHFDPPADA